LVLSTETDNREDGVIPSQPRYCKSYLSNDLPLVNRPGRCLARLMLKSGNLPEYNQSADNGVGSLKLNSLVVSF